MIHIILFSLGLAIAPPQALASTQDSFPATIQQAATAEQVLEFDQELGQEEDGGDKEESVTEKLGLDTKLFLAQLINFSLIFLVLWRFFWKPISSRLKDRTEKIEQSLQDAEDIAGEKANFDQWKIEETRKAKLQAADILKQAKDTADRIVIEARREAAIEQEKIFNTGKEQLRLEREEVMRSLQSEIAGMITIGVEKVLGKKLDPEKDKELIEQAAKHIKK